ncbi:hypothetical protein M431DRAFT_88554 [Trichoderma harzianum CBS 226.95]|uniref:DUF6546 domain-containing protein n=1 Tax=Trichoderma harzianum CBS 226.95 TaxID=983964 RepID=A0A2T4A7U7_TRIHA|nr:hypothetical protein M431DRAFT_88554 [Trichoderma harzianum CBS 226.95]PTB53088.1 hypothetical protein M431DRAFT_88554 [Trichoderma harzianum CBS 226.95]
MARSERGRGRGRGRSTRVHPYPSRHLKEKQEQQSSSRATWKVVPLELKLLVFEHLEDSIRSGKTRASVCATVCKEWYYYFEPYIFRRLTLSKKRVGELEVMVSGSRRQFVQHIWFRFERSVKPGVTPLKIRHGFNFLQLNATLFQLFEILSEWPKRSEGQPGIALELTAFSAVDPDCSMKDTVPDELKGVDLTVDSEPLNAIYEKAPSTRRTLTEHESSQQYEVRDFYVHPMNHNSTTLHLPEVKLITDLTVRRQMHVSLFRYYVYYMMESLPNLEFITYEPLALQYRRRTNYRPNCEVVRNITTKMPSSIRRLQVFEDSPDIHGDGTWGRQPNDIDGSLGRLVAEISQEKEPEVISMSFIIDAVDFFSDFQNPQMNRPNWKLGWLNLTWIVLTSPVISPERKDEIPLLLVSAAKAACHMPKLEIMELYYVTWNHGAIFAYVHDGAGSNLYWDSTWEWSFPPDVISSWKGVADVHGASVFEHEENLIQRTEKHGRGWNGDIMSLLRTKTTVVHPITYGNMMDGCNFM